MTGIDVALLRKALEHIDAHPEEHDQTVWARRTACGTTACLAGRTVIIAGHDVAWTSRDFQRTGKTVSGEYIRDVAARELGLTESQTERLFSAYNTVDDLWNLADLFTGGEITRPLR